MDDRQAKQLAMAGAAGRLLGGRLGRREWLKLCARGGVALGGLALLGAPRRAFPAFSTMPTPAQIRGTAGADSAIDPASDAHRFLRDIGKTFAGRTLRIVSEDTLPSMMTREILKHEFTPITGIKVEWEMLRLDRVLAKIVVDTARHAGVHDIFYLDQCWVGSFTDDLVPAAELLARQSLAYPGYDFNDILPSLTRHIASYKEQLMGIPYDIPIFIMVYRKDILDELRLAVPRTVPQFLETVKAVNEAKAPRVYGYAPQWKAKHYSLECNMTAWLWAHGGSIFDAAGRTTINDERAHAAMEYMLSLARYVPPGATTWDWDAESKSFSQGQAAFYLSWSEYMASFDDPAGSQIVGLAEPAPCPRENALRSAAECGFGETPGISHQGGSFLAISRYSRQADAAWVFLQWATSPDVIARVSILNGGAPIRASSYQDPRVKAMAKVAPGTTRHLDVTLDAIRHRMGTEPNLLPDWSTLAVDGFSVELGRMLTRQQSIKTTLDNMAAQATRAAATKAAQRALS